LTPAIRAGCAIVTGAVALLALLLVVALNTWFWAAASFVLLMVACLTYAGLQFPRYFYCFFIVNVALVLAVGLHLSWAQFPPLSLTILTMTLLFSLTQLCLIPGFTKRQTRALSVQAVRSLDHVQRAILTCLIEADYADSLYVYERRLHVSKRDYFKVMTALRPFLAEVSHAGFLNQISRMFDVLMDMAQLRRRVSDVTVFALCRNECIAISETLSALFADMIAVIKQKKDTVDAIALSQKIILFEDVFQHVITIAAKEPLAFILFIASLKVLREEIDGFSRASSSPHLASTSSSPHLTHNSSSPHVFGGDLSPLKISPTKAFGNDGFFQIARYDTRQAIKAGMTVCLALIIGHLFLFTHEGWMAITALLLAQTTRGAPARQGLIYFFFIACIAFVLPPHDYNMMRSRIVEIALGALLAMGLNAWVLPVRIYEEFRIGVLPILRALLTDMRALARTLEKPHQLAHFTAEQYYIETVLAETQGLYPGWVYEVGFNPGLRSGFRFFLIQLERMTEILFSLHYVMQQCASVGAEVTFSAEATPVLENNMLLCHNLIRHFQGEGLPEQGETDFVGDITLLERTLQQHVPVPMELLEMSPAYLPFVALVRDLKDMRELWLKLSMAVAT
jgi:hypothetical protein